MPRQTGPSGQRSIPVRVLGEGLQTRACRGLKTPTLYNPTGQCCCMIESEMLLIEPAWYDWFWLIPFLVLLAFITIGLAAFAIVSLYGAIVSILVVGLTPLSFVVSAISWVRKRLPTQTR